MKKGKKNPTSSGTYKNKLTEKSEIVEVDDYLYLILKEKAFCNQMVDKFLYYVIESEFDEKINIVMLVTLDWALNDARWGLFTCKK